MVPSRYITGKINKNKYHQFIMGALAQVKNGEEQFWKLCHILKNRMLFATGNLFEKIKNMLYKMLSDYNRKISARLYNMKDSNNNN